MSVEIQDDLIAGLPKALAPRAKGTRSKTKQRGYARPPGTGPAGETCGSCKWACRFGRYAKCGVMQPVWTGGPGTDILLRSPACEKWERENVEHP